MRSLIEIRQKTGLSQQALAEFLDVSRSAVNMAERSLRDLPSSAYIKLGELATHLDEGGENKKTSPSPGDDTTLEELKSYHQKKMDDHLFTAKRLQRILVKLERSHMQGETKLKLVDALSKKTPKTGEKNSDEEWLEYHAGKGTRKMQKNTPAIQKLTIEIEMHLGYAAVHENILNKLG